MSLYIAIGSWTGPICVGFVRILLADTAFVLRMPRKRIEMSLSSMTQGIGYCCCGYLLFDGGMDENTLGEIHNSAGTLMQGWQKYLGGITTKILGIVVVGDDDVAAVNVVVAPTGYLAVVGIAAKYCPSE
jgi:hypothetical protein